MKNRFFAAILFIGIGAVIFGSLFFFDSYLNLFDLGIKPSNAQLTSAKEADVDRVMQFNAKFLDLWKQYRSVSDPKEKNRLLVSLSEIATQRKPLMLLLAQRDPKAFLQATLPASVRSELPPLLRPDVETDLEESGTWRSILQEDFKSGDARRIFVLQTGKKEYMISSPENLPSVRMGSTIQTIGISLDHWLVLPNPLGIDIVRVPPLEIPREGKGRQNTLVMLVNLAGSTARPLTRERMHDLFFGEERSSVDQYYREASYGQTFFTGEVVDWYASSIPNLPERCDDIDDVHGIMWDAMQNAVSSGVDLMSYRRFVVYAPDCSDYGYSETGSSNFSTPQGTVFGTRSWLFHPASASVVLQVFPRATHELGHALGMGHANAADFAPDILEGEVSFEGLETYEVSGVETGSADWLGTLYEIVVAPRNGGAVIEYGDLYDVMGGGSTRVHVPHLNAPHKHDLGFFTSSQVRTVTDSGNYLIEPLETPGDGVKMLRIPRSFDEDGFAIDWYVLEFRKAIGYDEYFEPEFSRFNVTRGVLVHHHISALEDWNASYLLNMTPSDPSWRNAALEVGRRYTDPASRISFAPVRITDRGIMVNVFIPGRPPTVLPHIPSPVPFPFPILPPFQRP